MRSSKHGIDGGKPDGAAEIAHQIEQAGGVLHPLGAKRAERGVGHRHDRRTSDRCRGISAATAIPRNPSPRHISHLPGADGKQHEACHQHEARIELLAQLPGDRRSQEHREARHEHGVADHQGVVAADLREIDRDRGRSGRRGRCRARKRTGCRPRSCGWRKRAGRRSAPAPSRRARRTRQPKARRRWLTA